MAVRAGILLLISLCIWIRTSGSCTVSCSTDYKTLLNCSCSGLQPPETLHLQVNCSWTEMKLMLNANCEVSVQQPFCVMHPDIMEEIADVETECSAIAVRVRDHTATTKDSSKWQLREAVRPWPPFNVRVEMTGQSYNITWDNEEPPEDCLTFQVRVRSCLSAEKSPMFLQRTESFVQLEQSSLAPGVRHRVDVQAKMCPGYLYEGPWSEWSASTSWTTESAPASVVQLHISAGTKHYWLFTLLLFLMILMILIALRFPKVMFCQKRFKMAYVPNPGEFFKPLYDNYQGNFKAWVKPVFPEHNSLMNAATDTTLDHLNQSSPSADFSLSHNPILNVSLVSMSTVTLPSYCSMTSGCPREASSEKRPTLNLITINIVQDLNEEELSGNDYPLMDLDTIDSGFGECSSPPATSQLLCQDFEADSGPDTQQFCELHSNYVKQWTMGQSADDCLQPDLQKDM